VTPTAFDMPMTLTGTLLLVLDVPSPSFLLPFSPQHLTPPEAMTAQALYPLIDISTTPLESPTTFFGVALCAYCVPAPSWP